MRMLALSTLVLAGALALGQAAPAAAQSTGSVGVDYAQSSPVKRFFTGIGVFKPGVVVVEERRSGDRSFRQRRFRDNGASRSFGRGGRAGRGFGRGSRGDRGGGGHGGGGHGGHH
ncbi:MAG: hypothetical protein AAGE18_12075 [Pseudomonadota bacterium]